MRIRPCLEILVQKPSLCRRPHYYPLLPNYWLPSRRRNFRHRAGMVATAAGPQLLNEPMQHAEIATQLDDDVAAEQAKVCAAGIYAYLAVMPGGRGGEA